MKTGWQTSTLGDVLAVIRNGVNCKQDKSGNGDRISRIESISDATFDLDKVGYAELSERDKEKNRLQPGDILFSHINSAVHVGKTAVFDCDEPVYHGVNLLLMRPKEVVTSAYLDHALKYLFQSGYWRGVCKQSVNQASVNQQDISRVEIRYPKSLAEQQRIVGLLDEAFEGLATAKANAEKNLQNARALFESHLQSVFTQRGPGWRNDQLAALTVPDTPITYGVVKPGDEGEIAFVRGGDLALGKVRLSQLRTITRAVSDQYRRTLLRGGELLICLVGQPGQVAVAPIELAGANIARQVGLIRLKDLIDAEFVRYFLQSAPGVEALGARESGSVQQVINLGELRQVSVPYPGIANQRKIVAGLEAMETETQRLATLYERKIAALEALKKSLLHQAFTGQL
jgi:type I restriction enzyme S subunit